MSMKLSRSLALLLIASSVATAQHGQYFSRRAGFLNGTHVKSVLGNWSVIGQPAEYANRGAWRHSTNGYIGDESIIIGIEFPIRDYNSDGIPDTVHSMVVCPVARPQMAPRSEDPITGKPWAFEPRGGYFAASPNQSLAIRAQPETWPSIWPDHPEWGAGVWNGLFGPNMFVGEDEAYFVMDDWNDENFNFAQNNPRGIVFKPDTVFHTGTGHGLRVGVRYIVHAGLPYRDVLFKVYDITNESMHTYSKVVFGQLVGTYIGCTSTENAGEYNDDVTVYFSSGNFTLSWDFGDNVRGNPSWQGRVGKFGETFLQGPAQNKVASCVYYTPAGDLSLGDDESLWHKLRPGFYRHPISIIHDTIATSGEDGDYLFGSEYFSLHPGETRRIVTAIAYGYDKEEIRFRLLAAEALWHSHFDTVAVQNAVTITNFSTPRVVSGTTPIEFDTQPQVDSVDIWFSPDGGRQWLLLAKRTLNTGTVQWNTTTSPDCAFGVLKIFGRDSSGSIIGFNETSAYFRVDNATNGTPTIRILNEELQTDSVIREPQHSLHLLIGDPEADQVAIQGYYKASEPDTYHLFETFSAPTTAEPQDHITNLSGLPNSPTLRLKYVVTDGVTTDQDSVTFNKQNMRVSVPDSNATVIAGHSDVHVEIHVIDASQVRPDTYILTFADTVENAPKRLTVHNQTRNTTLINGVPFLPGTESPVFDGLSMYAEDFVTSIDESRTGWTRTVPYQVSIVPLYLQISPTQVIRGYQMPKDYKIVFYDTPVDTSIEIDSLGLSSIPIPFRVVNQQTQQRVRVGAVWESFLREIVFFEDVQGHDHFTWDVIFVPVVPDSVPHGGDTLLIYTRKGLSVFDSVRVSDFVLAVDELSTSPTEFRLLQNYPNPFNPTTTIQYALPNVGPVTLKIYNVLGQEVRTLVEGVQEAGYRSAEWNSTNNFGQAVGSGVYFYRLKAGDFIQVRKMLLLK